jgi:XRE family transcriptional regulator, regulator of sulfur utilization
MNIGSVIKNIRKQKGLTQSEFASRCEITQTYLSLIESNRKEPNLSTLKTIGEKLEIPLPILFFLSMTSDDVAPHKRDAFEIVSPSVKSLVHEFFAVR